jgi:lipid II isoglutaminyl synthase (glutamine-hydrolysing)
MNSVLALSGKFLSFFSRKANLGNGSTWPGHIVLKVNKNFIQETFKKSHTKIVLIAGTNGKTTTAKMIRSILERNNNSVFQNQSGANLLNGIASSLVAETNIYGKIKSDFAIFEIDENTLPQILRIVEPDYIVLLNLFRDQLDRYGEVNKIAENWNESFKDLTQKTTLILNADDPAIAFLNKNTMAKAKYFGLKDLKVSTIEPQYSADSVYCPNCQTKLEYKITFFSHLGDWNCPNCNLKRPNLDIGSSKTYPLSGIYNRYNTNAAFLTCKAIGIASSNINEALMHFKPAFGRQEKIEFLGKEIQIYLAKNPTSFNETLRTINNLHGKNFLVVLNDNIPDGTDVSWIWDINVEKLIKDEHNITLSGTRASDMGLRIKYGKQKPNLEVEPNLRKAILNALGKLNQNDILYILPTYSAMLEVRKILTGREIL